MLTPAERAILTKVIPGDVLDRAFEQVAKGQDAILMQTKAHGWTVTPWTGIGPPAVLFAHDVAEGDRYFALESGGWDDNPWVIFCVVARRSVGDAVTWQSAGNLSVPDLAQGLIALLFASDVLEARSSPGGCVTYAEDAP